MAQWSAGKAGDNPNLQQAPMTGIAFRKNPVSGTTIAATATIHANTANQDIVTGMGQSSCFFAVTGADDYCFQARSSDQIVNVNAVESNNSGVVVLPACQ